MVETVCSTREYIRVGKEDRPAAVVKSRLLKLERKHLEYVLWCFRRNTTEVRNIRAYLLTTLYNSYFSANSGTMAQVQHDLYGKGGDANKAQTQALGGTALERHRSTRTIFQEV